MKMKVSKLRANPFRKISKYPIDREKIKQLKASINETSFWDNVLVRPHPTEKGVYQISYGHHRHIALKELGIEEVDLPVRDLDDATMLRIMANENLDSWKTTTAVINETVLATKEFLQNEFRKYKTPKELPLPLSNITVVENGRVLGVIGDMPNNKYAEMRKKGVGQFVIEGFLGKNWKTWVIKSALATLKSEETVDREAVEEFEHLETASNFRKAVETYHVPKKKQKALAKELVKKDVKKRDVAREVRLAKSEMVKEKKGAREDKEVAIVVEKLTKIDDKARALTSAINGFIIDLNKFNVTQLKGVKSALAAYSLQQVVNAINKLYEVCSPGDSVDNSRKQIKGV